jgi:hypothetical protein
MVLPLTKIGLALELSAMAAIFPDAVEPLKLGVMNCQTAVASPALSYWALVTRALLTKLAV